jgi:hypothetical protein
VNEWKAIFATVVIFAAGVISGGLLVNYVDLSHTKLAHCLSTPAHVSSANNLPSANTNNPAKPNAGKVRMPEILTKDFVDRLEFELQLTLGQRADIEKIIADGQDESRKSFQDIRSASREKIRKQLTPKQVKLFDELFKQQHAVKRSQTAVTNSPAALEMPTNALPVVKTNAVY